MTLKELKQVCFCDMYVFDTTYQDTTYREMEMVIDHEQERYDDYTVVDITCCGDEIYVAIEQER